jgi:pimeloyl-ACP methyl ester carboxylesterase
MNASYEPRRRPGIERLQLRGIGHQLTRWPGTDPQPLILLHGFLDAGASFQFLADALPDRWTLLAPDWRGFGGSDWQTGGYWFQDYFADLEALLDATCADRPATLIGHSMGANIATIYAGLRPARVARVISLEGFGLARTRPEQAADRLVRWLDQLRERHEVAAFPSFEAFATMLQRRNPRLRADRADWIARCWAESGADGRVRARFDPAHKRVNPILYRREESEAIWQRIAAPLLFVYGAESEFLARAHADADFERLAALIAGFELQRVEGAGHMLHHEQPEAIAAGIERFLGAQSMTMQAGAQA